MLTIPQRTDFFNHHIKLLSSDLLEKIEIEFKEIQIKYFNENIKKLMKNNEISEFDCMSICPSIIGLSKVGNYIDTKRVYPFLVNSRVVKLDDGNELIIKMIQNYVNSNFVSNYTILIEKKKIN